MSKESQYVAIFKLRSDFKENITNPRLIEFLRSQSIPYTEIREDMFNSLESAVNEKKIKKEDLDRFLDKETRYGHNRTIFCYEIAQEDLHRINNLNIERLEELLQSKGWDLPDQPLIEFYLPENLSLAEYTITEDKIVNLTFVETINTLSNKNNIKRENNYYFVTLNPSTKEFLVRMRPRSNVVKVSAGEVQNKISDSTLFYKIKKEVERIFSIDCITSDYFKTTLYKIAKDLTEKAEEKWRKEVEYFDDEITKFSEEMQSKLEGVNPNIFNIKFRLTRLFERALIQSNFSELKAYKPGKKGFVSKFHFSDESGGKIKASSRENERAIELSEIYYDTRDTIDKSQSYDALWVNWFLKEKNVIRTKLESTSEYYNIHFFKYIDEGDMSYVLSEIRKY